MCPCENELGIARPKPMGGFTVPGHCNKVFAINQQGATCAWHRAKRGKVGKVGYAWGCARSVPLTVSQAVSGGLGEGQLNPPWAASERPPSRSAVPGGYLPRYANECCARAINGWARQVQWQAVASGPVEGRQGRNTARVTTRFPPKGLNKYLSRRDQRHPCLLVPPPPPPRTPLSSQQP